MNRNKQQRTAPGRLPLGRIVLLTTLLSLLLATVPAPALAARGHIFERIVGQPGSGAGELSSPHGVAVNEETGDVYVADTANNRIDQFTSTGGFRAFGWGVLNGAPEPQVCTTACQAGIPGTEAGQLDHPYFLAIDNSTSSPSHGDLYVAGSLGMQVQKFNPSGTEVGAPITEGPPGSPFGSGRLTPAGTRESCYSNCGIFGLAVDSAGALWVNDSEGGSGSETSIDRFDDALANSYLGQQRVNTSFIHFGLAVGESAHVFVLGTPPGVSGAATVMEFRYTAAGEFGEFVREEVGGAGNSTGVATDPSNDEVYVAFGEAVAHVTPNNSPVERFGEGHLTQAAAIAVDAAANATAYVSDSAADDIAIFAPEPPAKPRVEEESIGTVGSGSATLNAGINPRSESTEAPTSYRFEYGPCASLAQCATSPYTESAPVPDGSLAPNFERQTATVTLEGLEPATDYHFRVAAENEQGPAVGEELTFTTFAGGLALSLLDNRAWEMVTPPNKHGATVQGINVGRESVIQAAADGNRITYQTLGPVTAEPEGNPGEVQVLSTRTSDGWSSRDIASPHAQAVGLAGQEYRLFSPNLDTAIVEPGGQLGGTPLSPQTSERTLYLRDNTCGTARQCEEEHAQLYQPLVTGCPPEPEPCPPAVEEAADVPAGTEFGGDPTQSSGAVSFGGAAPDLKHVLLGSSVALTETPAPNGGAYEWSAAAEPAAHRLQLISSLPGSPGDLMPLPPNAEGASASGDAISRDDASPISSDGTRVVWGDGSHLYLRLRGGDGAETIQLDALQGGSGAGPPQALFETASAVFSRVFFTDTQRLTANAGAQEQKPDLYLCELIETAGGEECALTDLTPQASGEAAHVLGMPGASEDGSSGYFTAEGALTPSDEENENGEHAEAGSPNLYRFDGDTVTFVATLSKEDSNDWARGGLRQRNNLMARVSPDGRYLAFTSVRPLTGYDNRDVVSGHRDQEVFLYDAEAGSEGRRQLVCASCNPTNSRPLGVEAGDRARLIGGFQAFQPTLWLAADLPGWTSYAPGTAIYQSRYLSNGGRLFFNSSDALVPQDTNGQWDVYEYEPPQGGEAPSGDTCATSSPTYSKRSQGCVDLVSSGTSPHESAFLDASESGEDVFFLTPSQLAGKDYDSAYDVYDARVGGGFPEAPPPTPCEGGESCHGEGTSAPSASTPASSTVHSHGNVHEGAGSGKACKAALRRGAKLRHRARGLLRRAQRLHDPAVARRLRQRAHRLAVRARHLVAGRCGANHKRHRAGTRHNRRAGR